jgi:hypothetical protein
MVPADFTSHGDFAKFGHFAGDSSSQRRSQETIRLACR